MRKLTLKTFRLGVGGLGILSIVLMVYIVFFNPISGERNSIREYAFLCFGLPVLMLNFFAWFTPDLVQFYFSKKKKDDGE
jgi:uncharacterized membrane protein